MLSPIWGMTTSTAIAVISLLYGKLPTGALLAYEQPNLSSLQGKPSEQNHLSSSGIERSKCSAGLEDSPCAKG
jgi:hypothetical protein